MNGNLLASLTSPRGLRVLTVLFVFAEVRGFETSTSLGQTVLEPWFCVKLQVC